MRSHVAASIFTVVTALSSLHGCGSTDGGGTDGKWDSPTARAYLQRNFSHIPRITEALTRVIAAANGTPQNGVTFTNITGGVQGTIGIDLDNNGSMETSVDARLIYLNPQVGIGGGATLTVTGINAASTSGTATSRVTMGGSTVFFDQSSGVLHPTHGPSEITVQEGNLEVTPTFQAPLILGHVDLELPGGQSCTMIFESDGQGGWRIRVESDDFDGFTVP